MPKTRRRDARSRSLLRHRDLRHRALGKALAALLGSASAVCASEREGNQGIALETRSICFPRVLAVALQRAPPVTHFRFCSHSTHTYSTNLGLGLVGVTASDHRFRWWRGLCDVAFLLAPRAPYSTAAYLSRFGIRLLCCWRDRKRAEGEDGALSLLSAFTRNPRHPAPCCCCCFSSRFLLVVSVAHLTRNRGSRSTSWGSFKVKLTDARAKQILPFVSLIDEPGLGCRKGVDARLTVT